MTICGIEINELESEVLKAKEEFDRWATATTTASDKLRVRYLKFLHTARSTLNSKKNLLVNLQFHREEAKERNNNYKKKSNSFSEELRSLQLEEDRLSAQIKKLKTELRAEKSTLNYKLKKTETELKQLETNLIGMRECVALYEQVLGLTFLQGEEDELQLLMNNIDPKAPDRIFMFALRVGKGGIYQVTKLSPVVPGWREDLADLNRNPEAFYIFVRKLRKRFQQAVMMS